MIQRLVDIFWAKGYDTFSAIWQQNYETFLLLPHQNVTYSLSPLRLICRSFRGNLISGNARYETFLAL